MAKRNSRTLGERVTAAQNEFAALLTRHQVRVQIEQVTNSELGAFTRLVFVDNPPAPPAK